MKNFKHMNGVTMLEVLLGIVIFVVGMLALAHLQTNLTRSSSDANVRTVAANIGEEILENLRTFRLVRTDPDGVLFAFADIDADYVTVLVDRGGNTYTVTGAVSGFDFDEDGVGMTETADVDAGDDYDFKLVELTIAWDNNQSFQIDESQQISNLDMATGSITISSLIPSIPTLAGAKLLAEEDPAGGPPVVYNPGENPDVIRITLGDEKFKESTTPEPVIRHDLSETWFDVVTYSQATGENAFFKRREEFVAISCECTLYESEGDTNSDPTPGTGDGFSPAVWTGAAYEGVEEVNKRYGVQASTGQDQSLYCDVCCRDHHDSDTGEKYRPWMANNEYIKNGGSIVDHPHYMPDRNGVLTEVEPGDDYLEACRLVRIDGFFKVAQDFDMHVNNVFPENYLTTDGEVTLYSDYVKEVAESHFGHGADPGTANDALLYDGDEVDNPSEVDSNGQQLRSRGIYVDNMTTQLATNISHCFPDQDSDCVDPTAVSVYEMYPFFDIQVSRLARWSETEADDPVDITNEEIPSQADASYSRGFATLDGAEVGSSVGHSIIESSNVGLISTDPVSSVPAPIDRNADIYLLAGEDPDGGGGGGNPVAEGSLLAEGGTSTAADLVITGDDGVECSKPTNNTFSCYLDLESVGANPSITVSNYWKNAQTDLIICSDGLDTIGYHVGTDEINDPNQTTFEFPPSSQSGITFTIRKGSSPADC